MSVIPKIPRDSGGLGLGPLPGLYPGPAGDFKRPRDPSHTHAPLTTNPGSALGFRQYMVLERFNFRQHGQVDWTKTTNLVENLK